MNEELRTATEIAKDPNSFSWITYSWILFLAMWGGVVRVIREVKLGGKTWKQILAIFLGELVISGFVGMLTILLCEAAGFSLLYTGAMAGVAGYMGGRSLAIIEAIYRANHKGD